MRTITLFTLSLSMLTACPGEASFDEVRDDILLPSCGLSGSCHEGGAGELDFGDPAIVYDQLVDVESEDKPGAIRVIPGDPDNSYLIHKVEEHPDIVGDAMPPGFSLSNSAPEKVQILRDWIEAGALP